MPQARMFKAVDAETGRIIGVARWLVAQQDEGVEIIQWEGEVLRITDGEVIELTRRVELETLFTHPGYQGQGVASVLLRWGVDEAERLGLGVYFEATETRPLYERFGFGFGVVKAVDFDAGVFGGGGGEASVYVYASAARQIRST
ncbi:hypothetical protein BDW62DRAFT_204007 [Aspergillus aurantiobrunneus]